MSQFSRQLLKFAPETLKRASPSAPVQTKEQPVSPLLMARVSSDRFKSVVKVAVPKHRLNDLLLLYVRENDDIQAHDENNICKAGDWVLLRRQTNPIDPLIAYKVERVVYSYGNLVDPLTKRRSYGLYYDDEIRKLEDIKVEAR